MSVIPDSNTKIDIKTFLDKIVCKKHTYIKCVLNEIIPYLEGNARIALFKAPPRFGKTWSMVYMLTAMNRPDVKYPITGLIIGPADTRLRQTTEEKVHYLLDEISKNLRANEENMPQFDIYVDHTPMINKRYIDKFAHINKEKQLVLVFVDECVGVGPESVKADFFKQIQLFKNPNAKVILMSATPSQEVVSVFNVAEEFGIGRIFEPTQMPEEYISVEQIIRKSKETFRLDSDEAQMKLVEIINNSLICGALFLVRTATTERANILGNKIKCQLPDIKVYVCTSKTNIDAQTIINEDHPDEKIILIVCKQIGKGADIRRLCSGYFREYTDASEHTLEQDLGRFCSVPNILNERVKIYALPNKIKQEKEELEDPNKYTIFENFLGEHSRILIDPSNINRNIHERLFSYNNKEEFKQQKIIIRNIFKPLLKKQFKIRKATEPVPMQIIVDKLRQKLQERFYAIYIVHVPNNIFIYFVQNDKTPQIENSKLVIDHMIDEFEYKLNKMHISIENDNENMNKKLEKEMERIKRATEEKINQIETTQKSDNNPHNPAHLRHVDN